MAILNPVVSKVAVPQGSVQEVYFCPPGKTHAVVDVSLYKDDTTADSIISLATSLDANVANLTSVDYFIDDVKLIGTVNSVELNKIIVGQGEHLFVKVVSGPDVVVRVTGMEETNAKVLKAGRLAALSVNDINVTEIYSNTDTAAAYISASMMVFNKSTTQNAIIEGWISSSATPAISDKTFKINIPANNTSIVANILLSPNEKIFVKSSLTGTEYFINGIVVGV